MGDVGAGGAPGVRDRLALRFVTYHTGYRVRPDGGGLAKALQSTHFRYRGASAVGLAAAPMTLSRTTSSTATAELARPAGTELLVQITAGLSEGQDLRALLERFLDPIVTLAGAQAGAVRLLSDSGERLQMVSAVGLPDAVCRDEQTVDRHCGVCGTAADGHRIVWATELGACAALSLIHISEPTRPY